MILPSRSSETLLILLCLVHATLGSTFWLGDSLSNSFSAKVNDYTLYTEQRIRFGSGCPTLRYNYLYLKYQWTLPLQIRMKIVQPFDETVKITELRARTNQALTGGDASLTVMARVTSQTEAQLIFLCDTFVRCHQLKDDLTSHPKELQTAVSFVLIGTARGSPVKFEPIHCENLPDFNCTADQSVVFQRRVDGSLSFAQNWDAYVKGFGSPDANYWMGLDRLFAMTVTNAKNGYADASRCRLRIETEDFRGKTYWGEYRMFQVLGPDQNYRLRVGGEVPGSQLADFVTSHSEMQFSSYDRDHDTSSGSSISQMFGFGGWWYGSGHSLNLNGAYPTDNGATNSPIYDTVKTTAGAFVPMRRTLMMFKCSAASTIQAHPPLRQSPRFPPRFPPI